MDRILQLDPATLSLWYMPMTRGDDKGASEFLHEVAMNALVGDHFTAKQQCAEAAERPALQIRSVNLLSAVVHEQRHFVDVILTNFGQSLTRQFSTLWVNLPKVWSTGTTPVPITAAANPVRRRIVGLEPCPETLIRVAEDVMIRNKMLEPDILMRDLGSHGQVSFGGRAQLEALAFLAQSAFILREFGPTLHHAVLHDMPDAQRFRNEYAWIASFAESLGLEGEDGTINGEGLTALLYGSLMTRRWGQEQAEAKGGNSCFAVARFDPLFVYLRESQGLRSVQSVTDAWDVVNAACAEVFGRSAIDELREDLAHEANFIATVADNFESETSITAFISTMHEARESLASILEVSPSLVLSPIRFPELLERIDPVPIVVTPRGSVDSPRPGWREMWKAERDFGAVGRQRWCWATAPVDLFSQEDRINVVGDADDWLSIVMDIAPISKLLIRGRQFPSMLAAEYEYAEQTVMNLGGELRFDPMYARPLVDSSADAFWYLSDQEEARCDLCSKVILRGGGSFLSALAVRVDDRLLQWMFAKYGGREFADWARFQLHRDLEGWLTCQECQVEADGVLAGA